MTSTGTLTDIDNFSPVAAVANAAVSKNIGDVQDGITYLPDATGGSFRPVKDTLYSGDDKDPTMEVGIVGAGCAGLFTAMLFDYLKDKFGVKVDYRILEAVPDKSSPNKVPSGIQRRGVGGRLYTHYFEEDDAETGAKAHQYYDVGGMRFPNNPMMTKTFELFKLLGMDKYQAEFEANPKRTIQDVPKGQLVPYILSGENTPVLFNGVQFAQSTVDGKRGPPATAEAFKITGLPKGIMRRDPSSMVSNSIAPYLNVRRHDGTQAFWDDLMRKGDRYTVRQYLSAVENYDYNTVEFLETMNFGNRWYDQAFSEMVIDELEFAYNEETKWWCVMGGAQQLCYRMQSALKQRDAIEFEKIVDEVEYQDQSKKIAVKLNGESQPRVYDAVFNSASLGAQGHMKLEDLQLNWGTKQAIRSLGYGASCKVGIRFKSLWWMDDKTISKAVKGGVGRSDLPNGFCVYPSYNLEDDKNEPGVLLVSYTWSQQAEKIGSLIDRNSPNDEDELKRLLLHCLARLHTDSDEKYETLHKQLYELYDSHYAYDWYSDPYTAGAFAFFGPGQFGNMWQWVTRTNGKYLIIGEAASSHHAWVVGSLESAVRGVYQFLFAHSQNWKAASNALLAFVGKDPDGKPIKDGDKIAGPFGPVPEEFNRTGMADYPEETDRYPGCSAIAELARQQVAIEQMRLATQSGDQLNSKKVTQEMVDIYFGKEA